MRKRVWIQLLLVVAIAAIALGQIKVIHLKDGRKFTGEVKEVADGYQVKTKHAVLTFKSEDIASITDMVGPDDEYEKRLAKIGPTDAQGHLELGQWAMNEGMLEIAEKEFDAALKIDPKLELASLLLRRVKAKIADAAKPPPAKTSGAAPTGSLSGIPDGWLISQRDIYTVRLGEFSISKDTSAIVKFQDDVLDRYIETMQGTKGFDEKKFRRLSGVAKLKEILRNTDRDDKNIRGKILLKSDPKSISEFRGRIWPKIAARCASMQCHGAAEGKGGFKLLNYSGKNEKVAYSNFIILSQYARDQWRLVDRDHFEDSLLLTYGLPPKTVKTSQRHPSTKSPIAPMYRTTSSAQYKRVLKWIKSLASPPEGGDYDIKYKPPFGTGRSSGIGDSDTPKPEGDNN